MARDLRSDREAHFMHEMSYIIRFIDMAKEALPSDAAPSDIKSITVEIGELSGVLPEYLRSYYNKAVTGTELCGSSIIVNEIKATAVCTDCGMKYHPTRGNDYRCPDCGGISSRFISGREVRLVSLELEQT